MQGIEDAILTSMKDAEAVSDWNRVVTLMDFMRESNVSSPKTHNDESPLPPEEWTLEDLPLGYSLPTSCIMTG